MEGFPGYVDLEDGNALRADSIAQVMSSSLPPQRIWYTGPKRDVSLIGRCRLVANSLEELRDIDRLASLAGLPEGKLEMVGIRIIPAVCGDKRHEGISQQELCDLKRELGALSHLSLNGCFVACEGEGLKGKALGKCFRVSYELGKRLYSFLPATISYCCVCGVRSAIIAQEDDPFLREETEKAARIVSQQNETAFYATLLLD